MTKTLDLHFLDLPGAIASFLVSTDAGPILIETGPHSTLGPLSQALKTYGYSLEDVKHVFLTHIHLDHAGAAWAFAKLGATIYVHPFGAKHLTAPQKLMESARRIYKEDMDRLWGQMEGIGEAQVRTVDHQERITIGDRSMVAHHTPGHARHHIAWQLGDELFSGDSAGVKIGEGPVLPPCPPPDINIEEWKESVALIKSLEINKLHLTHYGAITNIDQHLSELVHNLDDWAQWIKSGMDRGRTAEEMTPDFMEYTASSLRDHGLDEQSIKLYEAANPSWMSVAGLMRYWSKK